jgi:hypothetical protein
MNNAIVNPPPTLHSANGYDVNTHQRWLRYDAGFAVYISPL